MKLDENEPPCPRRGLSMGITPTQHSRGAALAPAKWPAPGRRREQSYPNPFLNLTKIPPGSCLPASIHRREVNMAMKIYGAQMSRASRVLWCANELGVPYEFVDVPWENQKKPE